MPDDSNFNMIGGMTDDFTSVITNDIGVSFTYTPVVTTQRGMNSVRTEGTAVTRYGILLLKSRDYANMEEGFFENAEAVLIGKGTDTYVRDSKVTYGTMVYLVKNINEAFIYGNIMAVKVDLVKY